MEFLDAVKKRHSVRDFSKREVSREDLLAIVDAAKLTPSWANSQTWKLVIASGQTLEKIRRHHESLAGQENQDTPEVPPLHRDTMGPAGMKNVSGWMSGINNFMSKDPQAMAKDAASLYNAPAVAYLLMPRATAPYSAYDLGAFGQTLMLAATDRGIDSIPAMEYVLYPKFLHEALDVDNDYVFALGIGLGYEKEDSLINHFRASRMDNDEFLTFKD